MIRHALVAALLTSIAGFANATTLQYQGQYYATAQGKGAEFVFGGDPDYVFTDGYSTDMRIELTFDLENRLEANKKFGFSYEDDRYFRPYLEDIWGAERFAFRTFSMSDGLYVRSPQNPGHYGFDVRVYLETDDLGLISAWDVTVRNASGVDEDEFSTSSKIGDWAMHIREYATYDDEDGYRETAVYSTASTASLGAWSYTDVPAPSPVPLPASAMFMLSGFGALGLVRWRRRLS